MAETLRHRQICADELERDREKMLKNLRRYPQEIHSGDLSPDDPEYFRVVIDSEEELDQLISQLRASVVTPEEALNKSLVRPRVS